MKNKILGQISLLVAAVALGTFLLGSNPSVALAANTYPITATVVGGIHGTISFQGNTISATDTINVDANSTVTLTLTPDSGYTVASITDNGVTVDPTTSTTYTITSVTSAHIVNVTYALVDNPVLSTAGDNGSISPSGYQDVYYGSPSPTYTFTPSPNYRVATVTIDGTVLKTTPTSYQFTAAQVEQGKQSIYVTFAPITYTITASASGNGSISPSGIKTVDSGSSQTYTITPANNYVTASVTVNGTALSTIPTSYTFSNVTSNQTISATFAPMTFGITATAGSNGSITPSGTTPVVYGGSQMYTVTPSTGYQIASVTLDGATQTLSSTSSYTYTFKDVTTTHTIAATFAPLTYTITVTPSVGGTVSPGTTTVTYGGSQKFTVTPGNNYQIADVLIDGATQAIPSSSSYTYTFSNVTANHTILAGFVQSTYTFTITAGSNGTITGPTTVPFNGTPTYTITPNTGFEIASVSINGTKLSTTPSTYTFGPVNGDESISATFAPITYTITASVSGSGTISPPNTTTVDYGGSQTYDFTPANNYLIASVTVNGKVLASTPSSYTFSNVTANQTIAVAYVPSSYNINASAGSHGEINPSGNTSVSYQGSQTYNFIPDSGYTVGSVTVDGTVLTTLPTSYTFSDVIQTHKISVAFVLSDYPIEATAGLNGSISPAGYTTVSYQGSQVYTFTPDTGYKVGSVTVNGTKLATTPTSYTFTDVTTLGQTISVTFTPITYTVTASAGSNGSISPSGTTTVDYGGSKTYTITPATGYTAYVSLNGSTPQAVLNNTYTVSDVTQNDTVAATFVPISYTITVTAGNNGSVSPSGVTTVNYGGSQIYTVTPATGYMAYESLNGSTPEPVGNNVFMIRDITQNDTVAVTFVQITYTITASAGSNGSITSPGITTVDYGASQTYTIKPNTGYLIYSVAVDGVAQNITSSNDTLFTYTFSDVTAPNQTISATFLQAPYAVTGLNALSGNGHVLLTWNPNAAGVTYNVCRNSSGSVCTPAPGNSTNLTALRYVDTSVTDGTIYTYQVQAVNAVGSSSSNPVSIQATDVTDGLVGWWKFNQATTGVCTSDALVDASVNNNTATCHNSPVWISDLGGAMSFNGTSSYVSIANSSTLNITGSISIAAWVNPTVLSATANEVVSKEGGNGSSYYMWLDQYGYVHFGFNAGAEELVSKGIVPLNQWTHLFATWDGQTMSIYINGSLSSSAVMPHGPNSTGSNLAIGAYGAGNKYYFNGAIDGVRIFNRALLPSDVSQLYGTIDLSQGLMGWWKFNERASGALCTGASITSFADGDKDTGTCHDSPMWVSGKSGGAMSFNGEDSYISIANNPSLDSTVTGSLSIAAWVNPTALSSVNEIISKEGPNGSSYYMWLDQNGNVHFGFNAGAMEIVSKGTVPFNQWTHLLATWDGQTIAIYINGSLSNSAVVPPGPSSTSSSLAIGAYGAGNKYFFTGSIDDVRFYDRALSSGEASLLYNTGDIPAPPAPTGVSASYNLSTVQVSWKASTGAVAYYVKRSTVDGGPYNYIATVIPSATATDSNGSIIYNDTNVAQGAVYYYVVTAINSGGAESRNSNEASGLAE